MHGRTRLRRAWRWAALLPLVLVATAAPTGVASAAQDAYFAEYDYVQGTPVVAGFHLGADGSLGSIAGSPFGTQQYGVRSVAVAPDGRTVFVTEAGTKLHALTRAGSGALSPVTGSPFTKGESGSGLVVSPDGSHLYLESGLQQIQVFTVGTDGALTLQQTVQQGTQEGATSMVMSADGRTLYAAARGQGVLTYAVAVDGSLALRADASRSLGPSRAAVQLLLAPDGKTLFASTYLWGTDTVDDRLVSVPVLTDGSLGTPVTGEPLAGQGAGVNGIAITPNGKYLYLLGPYNHTTVRTFSVSAGGTLTALGEPKNVSVYPAGAAIDATGKYLILEGEHVSEFGRNAAVYSIGAGGGLTEVSGSPFRTFVTGRTQSIALSPDQPPRASFTLTNGAFDASASTDPDSSIAKYRWKFGDGTPVADAGSSPAHDYAGPGVYTVTLTTVDDAGCSTAFVTNGLTPFCNGSSVATTQRTVEVDGDGNARIITPPPPSEPGQPGSSGDSSGTAAPGDDVQASGQTTSLTSFPTAFAASDLRSKATTTCVAGACRAGKGHGAASAARARTSTYRIVVQGRFLRTPCSGRVRLVYRGRGLRTVARRFSLRRAKSGGCTFRASTLHRIGSGVRLPVKVTVGQQFLGNAGVAKGRGRAVVAYLRRTGRR